MAESKASTFSGPPGQSSANQGYKMAMAPYQKGGESMEFKYCEEVTKYEKLAKIGQGTFGEVFKAKHKKNKNIVALKKVLMENEKEGFPITALREIRILQLLRHDNVVPLYEICRTKATAYNRYKGSIYLVFEFCEHDLAGLLSNTNVKFSLGEIKSVIKQLLNGLYYIHSNKVLHRDMKAANILITKAGVLKLADFGLARAFSLPKGDQPNRYTNRVVTLWYRPPELLLGERNYGPAIDLWGAGCIMAEMWTRSPIMQGNTEQHQLTLISHLCGSITSSVWPGLEKLELSHTLELPKGQKRKVKDRLRSYVKDQQALDLIDKLLNLDPKTRIDADLALNHDFFWVDPMPCSLERMLSTHTQSMFEYLTPRRRIQQHPSHASSTNRNPHHAHPPNRPSQATTDQNYDRVF
ncbi:cyclin-dependent kinase 9-like [Lytechinus pictus]|uniref:cyclin-dependent kinase 9-like n=1 Tax=Lytechinus pictus TaxID=7653 RepID=UPI00240CEB91|nr:cyclin-dependent kinase 9-like [Lytechinus pictus]